MIKAVNRWDVAGEFLTELTRQVVGGPGEILEQQDLESTIRLLFRQDQQSRVRIEKMVARLALDGSLPPLDPWTSLLLWMRSMCALDFLAQILTERQGSPVVPQPPQSIETSELLSWLLTDMWNRRGDHWMKLVALEFCTPFPFYGLTPAE